MAGAIKVDGFLVNGPGTIKEREQAVMKNVTELDKSVVLRLELPLVRIFGNVDWQRTIRPK